jgi:ribosomal-protein-alanine N-acetyltransferase
VLARDLIPKLLPKYRVVTDKWVYKVTDLNGIAKELYEPLKRSLDAWESGLEYSFTIECAHTATFIGRISIRKHRQEEHVWNIGFWTHPEQQRQGYMTEVAQKIVEFGFTILEANRIQAYHALWNTGSEKVLKRIGMKFVCYIPQGFQKCGTWVEENLLAIEIKDWKAMQTTDYR